MADVRQAYYFAVNFISCIPNNSGQSNSGNQIPRGTPPNILTSQTRSQGAEVLYLKNHGTLKRVQRKEFCETILTDVPAENLRPHAFVSLFNQRAAGLVDTGASVSVISAHK